MVFFLQSGNKFWQCILLVSETLISNSTSPFKPFSQKTKVEVKKVLEEPRVSLVIKLKILLRRVQSGKPDLKRLALTKMTTFPRSKLKQPLFCSVSIFFNEICGIESFNIDIPYDLAFHCAESTHCSNDPNHK